MPLKIISGKTYWTKDYANEKTGSKWPLNLQVFKKIIFKIRIVK